MPDAQAGDVFLCVEKFVRVPVSMVFTCYKGKPKIWNAFPVSKERELRRFPCERLRWWLLWLLTCLHSAGLQPCCAEDCCQGRGYPHILDVPIQVRSSTESFLTHVHLFSHSNSSHSIHPLELALVWAALLLVVLVLVLLARNVYRHLHTPHLVQRLQAYSQGPDLEVAVTEAGTIVPSVSYYDQEEAANILSRHRRGGRTREAARREKTRKGSRKIKNINQVLPDDNNVLHLEMQLVLIDEKAEEKIIKDDQSQEEIIIDEILSMSMDALLETPKVPDRLLSPMLRRSRPLMSALARPEEQISAHSSQQSGELCSTLMERSND